MIPKKLSIFLLFLTIFALLATGCGRNAPAQPPEQPPAENGPAPEMAAALVEDRCARCHTLDKVYRERDAQLWPGIVTRMISFSPGLLSTDES
ncbi:MAG: hypothetical protein DDT19_02848 [Syntrophomonadaceae bacterium]|nr:hypothetical protein [Bacillota bacterium]